MKVILILTAPFGLGHTKAAEALKEILTLDQELFGVEVIVKDVFQVAYENLGRSLVNAYLKLVDTFPLLYGKLYYWGEGSRYSLKGRDLLHSILGRSLYKYLKKINPLCVICTHPTPAGALDFLVHHKKITIPIFSLITDFVGHNWWLYGRMMHYFVPTSDVKEYLVQKGIEPKKIVVSGIPVHKRFKEMAKFKEKQEENAEINDEKPLNVMIMGGGEGILPMERIVEACLPLKGKIFLKVITGSNILLYKKLKKIEAEEKAFLKVYGYVEMVSDFMAEADVLITKPGGVTMAEALAINLPMIIFKPIPGQEEGNSQYLLKNNVAIKIENYDEFKVVLSYLSEERLMLCKMQKRIAALLVKDSDKIFGRQILKVITKSKVI